MTASERWVKVTHSSNIPLHEGRAVHMGGHEVAIFNLGGRFVAVDNRCPHGGGPLADGIVGSASGRPTVTCPLHNWKVCLETGGVARPASGSGACVRSFEVSVTGGIVSVKIPAERPAR
ncbi:MAG: nitrite reductase small subunit NirD [Acidobacteria bacterium]|nr:nitrite reductase small subunit NirD [Acidobacteriota bacterium]